MFALAAVLRAHVCTGRPCWVLSDLESRAERDCKERIWQLTGLIILEHEHTSMCILLVWVCTVFGLKYIFVLICIHAYIHTFTHVCTYKHIHIHMNRCTACRSASLNNFVSVASASCTGSEIELEGYLLTPTKCNLFRTSSKTYTHNACVCVCIYKCLHENKAHTQWLWILFTHSSLI